MDVTIDGVRASLTLAAGTYTAATLAAEVQSKINGASAFSGAGISVAVTHTGGILSITSNRYGSASNVGVGGTGAVNLLGAAPVGTVGVDVAGTINGAAAAGSGQYLTGAVGNAADGLKMLVTGGATGSRGTVNYYQGYAYQLNNWLTNLLDSKGALSSRTDGINRSIKDIGTQQAAISRRLTDIEARYRKEFTALDTLIGSMTQTSNFLTQQLANLPKSA
jgi:flagellar hook-associated protein 2